MGEVILDQYQEEHEDLTHEEQSLLTDSSAHDVEEDTTVSKTAFFFGLPTPVKLILFNEVTERFAYYGNRAILTLFLTSIAFDESKAIIVFSLSSALAYTMPLIGGHIADAWLTRYWTIVLFSMIYFFGALLLAFAALPSFWDSSTDPSLVYIALTLTAIGTGGIKPNVSTLGAEQIFDDENETKDENENEDESKGSNNNGNHDHAQKKKKHTNKITSESFFYMFYFAMNVGSIFATLLIPIVRTWVSYFWAFMLPAIFMLISVVILLIGHLFSKFKITPPDGGVLKSIFIIIYRTISRRKWLHRSFIIPIPPMNVPNGPSSNFQVDEALVNVHDFVRFVHLNYDYIITSEHNIDSRYNNIKNLHYDYPSWLMSQYTCPYDPKSTPSTPRQGDKLPSPSKPTRLQQYNYGGVCLCSEGCTCGCQCNDKIHDPISSSQTIQSINTEGDNTGSFTSVLDYRNPITSPCKCSGGDSARQLSLNGLRHPHQINTLSPAASTTVLFYYDDEDEQYDKTNTYSDHQYKSSFGQISQPSSLLSDLLCCCNRRYSKMNQFMPSMDLASDEYSVLDHLKISTAKTSYKSASYRTPDVVTLNNLNLPLRYPDSTHITPSIRTITAQIVHSVRIVLVIIPVLCTLPVFWSLMNQQGSTWMVQAEAMKLDMTFTIFGKTFHPRLEPEQMSLSNPIFLSVFLPAFEYFLRSVRSKDDKEKKECQKNSTSQILNNPSNFSQTDMNTHMNGVISNNYSDNNVNITPAPVKLGCCSDKNQNIINEEEAYNNRNQLQTSRTTLQTDLMHKDSTQKSPKPAKTKALFASPLNKMFMGMMCASLAYICAAVVDYFIEQAALMNPPEKISIMWQLPQYICVTTAEVLISVTGLHFVFHMAPSNLKSLVTALYLFSSALGDILTGIFYTLFETWNFSRQQMFIAFSLCIILNSLGIFIIKYIYGGIYQQELIRISKNKI